MPMEIPSSFPELEGMSLEQLQRLQKDDIAFKTFFEVLRPDSQIAWCDDAKYTVAPAGHRSSSDHASITGAASRAKCGYCE